MSESKVAETAVQWTEGGVSCLTDVLFRKDCTNAETQIRKLCLTGVLVSGHNESKIQGSVDFILEKINADGEFLNSRLIADCVSCWRFHSAGQTVAVLVLKAISEKMARRELPLSMSEGILIGLIELYSDFDQDDALFKALYTSKQYSLLTYIGHQSVCITKEGSGRLSSAIKSFLNKVWNADSVFGSRRLVKIFVLVERWSRIHRNESAIVIPDLTYCEPGELFKFFIAELSARLFLLARLEVRLDVIASFAKSNKALNDSGGIDAFRRQYFEQ